MAEKGKKIEEIYQKKTQLEHILLRPDTYIGSVEFHSQLMWVFSSETKRITNKLINFVPGLFKIFDEILVNAADNKIRDLTMDTIRVDIDKENNAISIYNNGKGIPVEIHEVEKIYVPELIFGHLLTSSNYDDFEKKVTGGRNGYGAKLCNIFSTEFTVETGDLVTKKKFKQVFRNNMSYKGNPIITNNSKDEFTRITFKPDLKKFGMETLDDDIISLFYKRVYDLAGCVKNVKVYLNGERIAIKGFKQYVELYLPESNDPLLKTPPVYEAFNDRWEVCIGLSEGQFQQANFVNSICTYKGGTHVNYITDQTVSHLLETIKKKNKVTTMKPFQIKNHLWVFINCLIENPSFDSQTKENMTLKVSAFGSKCEMSDEFMKKVMKTGIVDSILNWVKLKQDKELKKTDGHKSSRLSGISKLDDANMAGTRQGHKCTLILTEGDSAKALAVSGLSVVGRDYYGVFPLRGKLLNVREAGHKQIMDNAEINYVKQILGLQHGKEYMSSESLRYGHIMIMTDQDHDGSHIKGLLINFLDHFWPSLLRIPGFLVEFITPIVKVTKGQTEISFYTIPEYEKWKEKTNDGKGWFIKYYKGLGTSTAADAKKYFSAMKTHMKEFSTITPEERQLIDMAFNKKKADDRKDWLKNFQVGTYMDHSVSKIKYEDFIHRELILFSMADNIRSIPCIVDGFKPGLRKILFACFKRKLRDEIKVAQLSGYIAEHSAYHHGDQSLCASIVGMAQDYVGSNNINLLIPSGQFGTRIQGGKDAASPRYIFTKLSPISRQIFKIEDDPLLNYLNDDGQSIEPDWYIPILPMVLVNGAEGIGTGWSTYIPNYNPKQIANNLLRKIDGVDFEKMHPWYRGFKGLVEELAPDRYKMTGTIRKVDNETIEITELPIGSWTQSYKEFLDTLIVASEKNPAPFIKDYKEYHTDVTVHFIIKLTPENMALAEEEGLDKKFKTSSTISLGNMVAFDQNLKIKKYTTIEEIMDEFFDLRLIFYQKRKESLADQLKSEWSKLDNKARFIQEIIQGTLIINKKKRNVLVEELKARGYKSFEEMSSFSSLEDGETGEGGRNDYDYLLSMPLWSLTLERIEKLNKEKKDKEEELKTLLALTPKDLWRMDLKELIKELDALSADYSATIPVFKSSQYQPFTVSQNAENKRKLEMTGNNEAIASQSQKSNSHHESQTKSTFQRAKKAKNLGTPNDSDDSAFLLSDDEEKEGFQEKPPLFKQMPTVKQKNNKRVINDDSSEAEATSHSLSLPKDEPVKSKNLTKLKLEEPTTTQLSPSKKQSTYDDTKLTLQQRIALMLHQQTQKEDESSIESSKATEKVKSMFELKEASITAGKKQKTTKAPATTTTKKKSLPSKEKQTAAVVTKKSSSREISTKVKSKFKQSQDLFSNEEEESNEEDENIARSKRKPTSKAISFDSEDQEEQHSPSPKARKVIRRARKPVTYQIDSDDGSDDDDIFEPSDEE